MKEFSELWVTAKAIKDIKEKIGIYLADSPPILFPYIFIYPLKYINNAALDLEIKDYLYPSETNITQLLEVLALYTINDKSFELLKIGEVMVIREKIKRIITDENNAKIIEKERKDLYIYIYRSEEMVFILINIKPHTDEEIKLISERFYDIYISVIRSYQLNGKLKIDSLDEIKKTLETKVSALHAQYGLEKVSDAEKIRLIEEYLNFKRKFRRLMDKFIV